MKLRCKPGDEALIIKGTNSGKVVYVEERLGTYQPGDRVSLAAGGMQYFITFKETAGFFWWCRARGLPLIDANGREDSFAAVPDHWLIPLRGEKDPEALPRVVEKPDVAST